MPSKRRGKPRVHLENIRVSSRSLYLLLGLIFLLLMVFDSWISSRPIVEATQAELTEFNKKQIDAFTDTNKLLTTLATALIGVTTGFLLNRDQKVKLSRGDFRRAILSWSAAGLSLYCGQLSYRQLLWMLGHQFCDVFHDSIWWPTRAQFWAFLISAVALADFVYRTVQATPQTPDVGVK